MDMVNDLVELTSEDAIITKNEYNGWSNYATWRVNLEIVDGIHWSPDETTFKSIYDLSVYIKDTVETAIDGDGQDTTALVLGYAHAFIEDVNYMEIAQSVAEAYPELITGVNTQDGEPLTDNS